MHLQETLSSAATLFDTVHIPTARLDAELLLAHVLGVERTWLVANGEEDLEVRQAKEFERLVARRLEREPIAYLVGHKEFYGREFTVTPDVLIPRPETEDLVELALECLQNTTLRCIDVGTGSGCVGITLKLERPAIDVTLSDISLTALDVSRQNAEKLGATVEFVQSDLLAAFTKIQHPKSKIFFDLIVANLPYVDESWEVSPETAFEPHQALFAENGGLRLINHLIGQAGVILKPGGFLLLEADPEQHASIINFAHNLGFSHVKTQDYALALKQRT